MRALLKILNKEPSSNFAASNEGILMTADILPDFSEAADYSTVEPGVYKTRVIESEVKTSAKGNTYINWKLEIFGAEGEMSKFNKRTLFAMTMTSGAAAGKLKDFAKACGRNLESGKPFSKETFHGCELMIQAEKNIKPDGTEGFPNIRKFMPLA